MDKRVLMVATVPSMIGQFNMNNIKILLDMGYQVDVATDFNDTSYWPYERIQRFKEDLGELGVKTFQLNFSRSPLRIDRHLVSYKEVINLIKERQYFFIHTHTPIASAIVRISAHKTETRIVYTAHGFHFYDGAPLKNWFVFYPIEKWLSKYTDVLITINKEDYKRANKKFHAKKIVYVPGVGIDTKIFRNRKSDRAKIRAELGVSPDDILLISVGELSTRKNHTVVLDAIKRNNNDIIYLIVGEGDLREKIKNRVKELNISEQVKLLGYRNDIKELLWASDIFVFPSLQEGLPVALMEAIATGIPVVASNIRGNNDLITDGVNGYLVRPKESADYSIAIDNIVNGALEERSEYELKKSVDSYDLHNIRRMMKAVYIAVTERK